MTTVSHIRSAPKFRQTVLLIDDQSTMLDIHAAILQSLKLNLKIVTMTDPVEALAWLQNKQVDLIVTDYHMHQMNGMQFLQAIQQAENIRAHAIIVVTVLKDKATHRALISAGAKACLTKPVQAEELSRLAKDLLAQSKKSYDLALPN